MFYKSLSNSLRDIEQQDIKKADSAKFNKIHEIQALISSELYVIA